MDFIDKFVDSLEDVLCHSYENAEKIKEIRTSLDDMKKPDVGISMSEFFSIYEMYGYNIDSKRNDRRLAKTMDFKGVYILHNLDNNKYFIGNSSKVLRKISRQFCGNENQEVYQDFLNANNFMIYAYPCKSPEDDNNLYEKTVREQYKDCDFYGTSNCEDWISAGNAYYFTGKKYNKVEKILKKTGFNNIDKFETRTFGILFWRKGRVYKISINNNSNFTNDNKFRANDKIILYYYQE